MEHDILIGFIDDAGIHVPIGKYGARGRVDLYVKAHGLGLVVKQITAVVGIEHKGAYGWWKLFVNLEIVKPSGPVRLAIRLKQKPGGGSPRNRNRINFYLLPIAGAFQDITARRDRKRVV